MPPIVRLLVGGSSNKGFLWSYRWDMGSNNRRRSRMLCLLMKQARNGTLWRLMMVVAQIGMSMRFKELQAKASVRNVEVASIKRLSAQQTCRKRRQGKGQGQEQRQRKGKEWRIWEERKIEWSRRCYRWRLVVARRQFWMGWVNMAWWIYLPSLMGWPRMVWV